MTVLADFHTIIGDNAQRIPFSPADIDRHHQLGVDFDTGGRISSDGEVGGSAAFLIYTVGSLSFGGAQVFVNGQGPVGVIQPSSAWSTQVIAMAGSRLASGMNQITVTRVTEEFWIKDLICFYHQSS